MKQLLDFIPLIVFFGLYKTHDIYIATGALIVATLVQIAVTWLLYKKIEKTQVVTAVMVTIFGGMTLFFRDENFIIWKVTIVYVIFAAALLISQWMDKSLIKGLLGKEITLPDAIWRRVNYAWIIFFSVLAVGNIYVAYKMPLDVWVNFKVFGLLILTLLYTLATGVYIYKNVEKAEE